VSSIEVGSFEDHAFGSILGAFIGDSCGSFLEFAREVQVDSIMKTCMQMPGGGPFNLIGGQVTDDSELAMSLMWGLIGGSEEDANTARVQSEDQVIEEDAMEFDNGSRQAQNSIAHNVVEAEDDLMAFEGPE